MGVVWSQACASTGFRGVLEGFGWSLDSDLEAPFDPFFDLVAWVVRLLLAGCFPTPPLGVAAPQSDEHQLQASTAEVLLKCSIAGHSTL
jgi:hypothetical protein